MPPEAMESALTDAPSLAIELMYQDEGLLVLNKPAGLLSVPGRGEDKQDCLSARVQEHFPEALVVHRLDMATSGLLIMARSTGLQKRLNDAFAAREVHKRYVAVVQGRCDGAPPADSGEPWRTIDLPILVDWPRRPLRKIDHAHGKPSSTRWRPMGFDAADNTTRLELDPVTGRSHQLRVHLLALGHPILGDALYAPASVAARSPRLLLHATALALAHPASGEPLQFHCPCPF